MSDALEKAVLSGALTGQQGNERDPDGIEPIRRHRSLSNASSVTSEDSSSSNPALVIPEEPGQYNHSAGTGAKKGMATQTGVKGVLTDYRASNEKKQPVAAQRTTSSRRDDDEDDDRLDEEAMEAYTRQRMLEMKLGSGERSSGDRRFGQLREIGVTLFEKMVLDEEAGVKVIVHLYDAEIERCMVLNHHLIRLARDYPQHKFLIISAWELDFASESGDVVLPTILVYDGGELVANLVAIDQAWNRRLEYDIDEVKKVLIEHKVISLNPSESLNISHKNSIVDYGDDE